MRQMDDRERAERLLKAVTALWHAFGYFTVEELNQKPDRFHDLVELADELCAPFRNVPSEDQSNQTGRDGRE